MSTSSVKVVSPGPITTLSEAPPSSCYIYGIAELGKQIKVKSNPIGMFNSKAYTICFRDISAIISRTRYEEYDPTDENVLTHNSILQEVHDEYKCTVIPLRFCTIAKSEFDVQKILSNGYYKFKQKLKTLNSKAEVAVKVYCEIETFKKAILSEGSIVDEKMVLAELQNRTKESATTFLNQLKTLSKDHVLNDLIFDDLIMNAAFLIEESKSGQFISAIRSFEERNGRYLKVEWSGPYVPYSFADPES
jgi:hypothetical protein